MVRELDVMLDAMRAPLRFKRERRAEEGLCVRVDVSSLASALESSRK